VVRIGPTFALEHRPTGRIPREVLNEGTDRIMAEIAALLSGSRPG
jgi:hypothetical protein